MTTQDAEPSTWGSLPENLRKHLAASFWKDVFWQTTSSLIGWDKKVKSMLESVVASIIETYVESYDYLDKEPCVVLNGVHDDDVLLKGTCEDRTGMT